MAEQSKAVAVRHLRIAATSIPGHVSGCADMGSNPIHSHREYMVSY